jgi:hypothetical protein
MNNTEMLNRGKFLLPMHQPTTKAKVKRFRQPICLLLRLGLVPLRLLA